MQKSDFIFSISKLADYLTEKGWDIDKVDLPKQNLSYKGFFLLIPTYYVDLINWYDADDPLRKMVLISDLESEIKPYELRDPIGDDPRSPTPGIIHRYPDRCLLMFTNVCAVHCRFCFRKNLLETKKADFAKSISYIAKHKKIWEVILSGGDPFMFTDHFLKVVTQKLRGIEHVKMIRFHTRTPAVYPQRITKEFLRVLSQAAPVVVVVHINHPREITKQFISSVKRMRQRNIMLLSQTVLMKGVNNDAATLASLFRSLVEIGIKPYYLHHPDLAAGTDYFRVSVAEGKRIMQTLRGNVSGVCIPEYVIDTPGGYGKIPVFWFRHTGKKRYEAVNFEGRTIVYTDHAKEEKR